MIMRRLSSAFMNPGKAFWAQLGTLPFSPFFLMWMVLLSGCMSHVAPQGVLCHALRGV